MVPRITKAIKLYGVETRLKKLVTLNEIFASDTMLCRMEANMKVTNTNAAMAATSTVQFFQGSKYAFTREILKRRLMKVMIQHINSELMSRSPNELST